MTSFAGALCTPSCVSQRAKMPATCPDGGHIDSTAPRRVDRDPRVVERRVRRVEPAPPLAHLFDVLRRRRVEDREAVFQVLAEVDHRVLDALDVAIGLRARRALVGDHGVGHATASPPASTAPSAISPVRSPGP